MGRYTKNEAKHKGNGHTPKRTETNKKGSVTKKLRIYDGITVPGVENE